jgi:hypothetical protein
LSSRTWSPCAQTGCGLAAWARAGAGRLALLLAFAAGSPLWAQSARIALRWGAVPGAAAYELQIARDTAFVEVVLQTRTTTPGYRWENLPTSTHWWRVRSIDAESRASEWSQARSVAVDSVVPVAKSPADNAVAPCGSRVTFLLEPSSLVKEFILELAPRKDFSEARELRSKEGKFDADDLAPGVWYWRASAVDLQQKRSQRSPARALNVRLSAPKPKAVPDTVPGGQVALGWSTPACATSYLVEAWSAGGDKVTVPASTSSFVFKTSGVGDYRWRVTGLDAAKRQGEWSGEVRFRARLVAPVPKGESVSEVAELAWQPVPGAAGYRVEVSAAPDFKTLQAGAAVHSSVWRSPKLPPGRYAWRVMAKDAAGNSSAASEPRAFEVTAGGALQAPEWETPEVDAVLPTGREVMVAWRDVRDADRYVVEVDGRPLVAVRGLSTKVAPLADGEHRLRLRALGAQARISPWSSPRAVFVGTPSVDRAVFQQAGTEVLVALLDKQGRPVAGARPRFSVRHGRLGAAEGRGGRWLLQWEPPNAVQDVLLVDERAFHFEQALVEPPRARLELSLLAGGVFSGGAVASPSVTVALAVPLPLLDRRPLLQLRSGLYGASARVYLDGRLDAAGATAVPVSLLLGWRQPLGAFELRASAGVTVQFLSITAGPDAEGRAVPGFEVAVALGRRLGPGLLQLEVSGLYSRVDSTLAKLDAGGVGLRLGYALPFPVGSR